MKESFITYGVPVCQKLSDAYRALDAQELQVRRSKAYIALLKRQLMAEEGWGAMPRDERIRELARLSITREHQEG